MSKQDNKLDLELRALNGDLSARQRAKAGLDDASPLAEVAAAYDLARNPGPYEPLPEHLVRRIQMGAALNSREAPAPARKRSDEPSLAANLAWFAAAAAIVAAIAGWWPRGGEDLTQQVALDQLEATAESVIKVALDGTDDAAVRARDAGEVIWSQSEQRGYMKLRGLVANDPEREQYQLWIFDGGRAQHPVDGGVFDVIAEDGESIVPVDAKLAVHQPAAFAITVERPGGVVVSEQGRVAAIGKVTAADDAGDGV